VSLTELRLALSVGEALMLLTFPGDERIMFPTPGRIVLGPEWRRRGERRGAGGTRSPAGERG
jgi:hypothetical protein